MRYGGLEVWVNGHLVNPYPASTRDRAKWERAVARRQARIVLGDGILHVDWDRVGGILWPDVDWSKVSCWNPCTPQRRRSWKADGCRFWRCPQCHTVWVSDPDHNYAWRRVQPDPPDEALPA